MSSETSFFDPIKCEIVDSFVRYTKLKGTKGKGEAWLYLGRDLDLLFFKLFFSNFRKDNKYFFLKKNLIDYIENASHEYEFQNNFHLNNESVKGYRNNIFEKYNYFKKTIYSLEERIFFLDLEYRVDGGRFYIRPKKLDKNHPWNLIRDIALPQISEFQIQKIRMPENYNFSFELKFSEKNFHFLDHNSEHFINYNIMDLKKRFPENSLEYHTLVKARYGQGFFKNEILKRMNCCLITGSTEILEAAHIKPWTLSNDEEKIDGFNGILLTPNCHKLFDKGLVSFDKKGILLISKNLKNTIFKKLIVEDKNINKEPILNKKTLNYLNWHRDYFKKNFN
tara:strand:- start:16 stop:1026 length:1011 start_codon:yes stop_codon:yes gene_type:complete